MGSSRDRMEGSSAMTGSRQIGSALSLSFRMWIVVPMVASISRQPLSKDHAVVEGLTNRFWKRVQL